MLRIGETAKKFHISNRTLRYWEEKEILQSTRLENGYRYYDDENVMRIQQIVLLRKLQMPITEIERVLIADNRNVAVDALTRHLGNLRQESDIHRSLAALVEQLIARIQTEEHPERMFTYPQDMPDNTFSSIERHFKFLLSERDFAMLSNPLGNVRIVRLPAMTVASYRAESATPEDDCSKVFNRFVLEHKLHKRDGYRYFGFNNPNPTDGNPVYGYEMWVSIPDDFTGLEPLKRISFRGGLYASISTQMNEIGERWQLLYDWCKSHEQYDFDPSAQWLEECSMDFESFISDKTDDGEKQLDLLAPIKPKQ